jgi:hypothetical protein
MSISKKRAFGALASVMMVGLGACSNGGADAVSRIASPTSSPDFYVAAATRTATVCKAGTSPTGAYSFSTLNTGSTNPGDVLTSPVVINVVNGGPDVCAPVFTRSQSASEFGDAAAILTVTEAAAAGTILGNITFSNSQALAPVIDIPNRKITVGLNAFHDATVTFHNVSTAVGCTYTQGWWKQDKRTWPTGYARTDIFDGGASYLTVLNTPPKGSQYLILAHQYITATLNVANGAVMPADVKAAYDKATAYFAAGGAGAGSGNIDGVAAILDDFNNGVSVNGPPHCE